MRQNLPVTQREFPLDSGTTLMSTTDADSRLTYANAAFIDVSGYARDELTGQPHNIVRHPDMPREAFADMWATLKAGISWTALVKNRRKDGDHYWVRANATPIRRNGQVVGYMSVRTTPGRDEVAAAEALYRDFREGRAGSRAFHRGLVVRTGWLKWTSTLQLMPVRWRVRLGIAAVVAAGCASAALAGGIGLWPVMAVLAVAGLLGTGWIEQQVSRPLQGLLAHAQLVAAGQLAESPSLNRVDEIGLLARAINQSGLNLRSLLDDVAHQVAGISAASTQIAHGNADLCTRTERAAASLQQTATSITQMTGTVAHNAQRTSQAEQLAREASQAAGDGNRVVDRVGATMSQIESGSHRIAEIIGLIDGIAFQTNILALNAAVEAARAGEQGRGFAVVAAEVRNLAQRSAAAAKDIKALIGDSVRSIEQGAQHVRDADATMRGIVQRVRDVSGLIDEIAHATTEQSQGITQVEAAVMQIDEGTQQNAALVEQSAAAAESLKHQALRLAEAVGAFRGHQAA